MYFLLFFGPFHFRNFTFGIFRVARTTAAATAVSFKFSFKGPDDVQQGDGRYKGYNEHFQDIISLANRIQGQQNIKRQSFSGANPGRRPKTVPSSMF